MIRLRFKNQAVKLSPASLTTGEHPLAAPSPAKPGAAGVGSGFDSRAGRYAPAMMLIGGLSLVLFWLPGLWLAVAALALALAVLTRFGGLRLKRTLLTRFLIVVACAGACDYLAWRIFMTNWENWWIAGALLVAEIFGVLHTLGFHYTLWPRPPARLNLTTPADTARMPVFIFIPTVNEGPEVLAPTIAGALAARWRYLQAYPGSAVTIVVCNDGLVAGAANWPETEQLARRLGVKCLTRTKGGGAKAGNIEAARRQLGATGECLIVIFDADQIAEPDFLLKTVPLFADPSIGWVQTGQYYRNLDNPVADWANEQQNLFYKVICPGKSDQNAVFICGTNVVIRAKALDQIGGFPQDCVTEDIAASIELHSRWRSIYLPGVLATGLGPMDLPAYFKQQRRWATGTLSVLRRHWRAIFLPGKPGLSLEQRIQYAISCTHYLCGLRDLVYILAPVVFILTGLPAVAGSYFSEFMVRFAPFYIGSLAAFWYVSWSKTRLRGIILGFGCFPVLVASVLTILTGRRIGFAVTSKQRSQRLGWYHLLPHLLVGLVCVGSLAVAVNSPGDKAPLIMSALWVVYSLAMLAAFLGLGWADFRASRRAAAPAPAPVPPLHTPAEPRLQMFSLD